MKTIQTDQGKIEVPELSTHEHSGLSFFVYQKLDTYYMTEETTGYKVFVFDDLLKADKLLSDFISRYGVEHIQKLIDRAMEIERG